MSGKMNWTDKTQWSERFQYNWDEWTRQNQVKHEYNWDEWTRERQSSGTYEYNWDEWTRHNQVEHMNTTKMNGQDTTKWTSGMNVGWMEVTQSDETFW